MKVQKVSSLNIPEIPALNAETISAKQTPNIQQTLNSDKVSFTGQPSQGDILQLIDKIVPRYYKGIYNYDKKIGEFQNILLNSIGTGLVAPIFIKWNPLSKTDSDTKTYTAWRQPVSAVLAIATQAVITLPFKYATDYMTNNGLLGKIYNKTPLKNIDTFTSNLLNDNKIIYGDGSHMDDKSLKDLIEHTFDNKIKSEEAELKRYKDEKYGERLKISEYYKNNSEKAKKILTEIKDEIKDFKTPKEAKKYLDLKIRDLKLQNEDKELIRVIQETSDRGLYKPKEKRSFWDKLFHKNKDFTTDRIPGADEYLVNEMKAKINKNIDYVEKYSKMTTHEEVEQSVTESLKKEAESIKDNIDFLKELKDKFKTENMTVKNIENVISEKIRQLAKDDKNRRLKYNNFSTEVFNTLTEFTKNNIKIFKQKSGMIVSCAMLPVTCALLNWLYPIFMDAFFPNLSNKKHSKVSAEYVENATKNSGVKS